MLAPGPSAAQDVSNLYRAQALTRKLRQLLKRRVRWAYDTVEATVAP